MSEEPKKIEIVSGKKTDLEISDVSTYLNIARPKAKDDESKKEEIVIPQPKKKETLEDKENEKSTEEEIQEENNSEDNKEDLNEEENKNEN